MKTDMQAIYPLVFIVLLVAFTQGCTGGQHQVSSPIGPLVSRRRLPSPPDRPELRTQKAPKKRRPARPTCP